MELSQKPSLREIKIQEEPRLRNSHTVKESRPKTVANYQMKKYQSTVRSGSRGDREEDKSEESCNEPEFNSSNALLSINRYNVLDSLDLKINGLPFLS
jgi:hypothetical protein